MRKSFPRSFCPLIGIPVFNSTATTYLKVDTILSHSSERVHIFWSLFRKGQFNISDVDWTSSSSQPVLRNCQLSSIGILPGMLINRQIPKSLLLSRNLSIVAGVQSQRRTLSRLWPAWSVFRYGLRQNPIPVLFELLHIMQ